MELQMEGTSMVKPIKVMWMYLIMPLPEGTVYTVPIKDSPSQ